MIPGLSAQEAARRLIATGPNEIAHAAGVPAWKMLARQFTSPLVVLLLAACALSIALKEVLDSLAIGAIVILNGGLGFWLEHSAQNAVLALRSMTAPRARVVRDGVGLIIPSRDIVPGDLLVLEAGDIVAADARLVEVHDLATSEASLTGESLPIAKRVDPVPADAPLAERFDRVFLGTHVTLGTGAAEVIATGMGTELGRIANLIDTAEDSDTPLQVQLARVGRSLMWMCLAIVAVVALVGLAGGKGWLEVVMIAVPLAVAAVPEGLPAIVTIALAVGVRRMAERNVLVRRLPAVETLGAATVICTDKTGTLTTGVMQVRELWGPDQEVLMRAAASCIDAELHQDGTAVGDPTEIAILQGAAERGITRDAIEVGNPRAEVHPFDGDRKRMSILRADGHLYVKGAVDGLLPLCTSGGEGALEANNAMAGRGMRVLGVAIGDRDEESELRFVGLVGLADPPRPEAITAIAEARRAGITTVMITGDHPITALAIAREMGLVLDGEDESVRVHARSTPEEKLRIVREWKATGAVVAMTGDGVNDAPALREAHIGVAMGKGGTEVTREAADMVLADDNFASIVAAIREGRGIWVNIQKTVVYLLGGNLSELMTFLVPALMGLPMPLLPLQLLWINLVTDGLPALALVMDPPPEDALDHPPRAAGASLLGRAQWLTIGAIGLLDAVVVVGTFVTNYEAHGIDVARDMTFSVLVFVELFRAFAARSPTHTLWEVGAFTNLRLLAVVGVSAALQVGLHEIPAIETMFHLTPLTSSHLVQSIGLGLIPVTVIEISKLMRRLVRRR